MISSHTGFQPLKEVWLGDCYPASWYSDFDSQAQDVFGQITELTKHDLTKFQTTLEKLGVQVRRPNFDNKQKFQDWQGNLVKPPITPRDWAMVLDTTLYIIPQYENQFTAFEQTLQDYKSLGYRYQILDRSQPDPMCYLNFPSTVRVGKDLFVDCAKHSPGFKHFQQSCQDLAKSYRVHVTHTGDHSDGVFCPVAPKTIFTSHYRSDYSKTFPGWRIYNLNDTTVGRSKSNGHNGQWWAPNIDLPVFNKHVIRYAKTWIGNSLETVFEVNMLVVDEKNICVIVEDHTVCKQLEELGFNVHVVDFRCRGFWDGGLHCLTVDIHRHGSREDYWPERGPYGIYQY